MRPGQRNLITDVPGLRVGHAQDAALKSGVTVLLGDCRLAAGVHVMGGAPGTRETDLLAPGTLVGEVDALVLSGGSAYGLASADGVALGLPALMRAAKLQKRSARVGFDWPATDEVVAKIVEEAGELAAARDALSPAQIEDELGDLLFALANLARHLGVDPEAALRGTNDKFTRRFRYVEAALAAAGTSPAESDLAAMDALWDTAKAAERDG